MTALEVRRRLAAPRPAVWRAFTRPEAIAAWADASQSCSRTAKALDDIARSGLTLAKLTVAADMLGELLEA